MLPEELAGLLDSESFKELSKKLDEALQVDYLYSRQKHTLVQVIASIAEAAYKKGRLDASYYLKGPTISLYKK